jgi:hypothetical protein
MNKKIQGKISLTPNISGNIKTSKIYPDLEDLEITPSDSEQKFKSSKYGYDNVTVKAVEGITENLTTELTEQEELLDTQEITIENIIIALEGKAVGGGIIPTVEGNTLILSHANVEGGVLSI